MTSNDISNLQTLSVTIENHIAHIQFARPHALNTMIDDFWRELPAVVRNIDAESAARVIVISAQGKHFSAGIDLSMMKNVLENNEGEPARCAERMRRLILYLQDAFTALEQIRIPVLAAVQGAAIGGAIDMLCACDCRYATTDAYFSIKETQMGLTADVGTLQRIHHVMPQGLARELAYTGRDLSAQEALSCGFVNRVFESQSAMLEAVMNIAESIAMNSPMAVSGTKEMLNYSREHTVSNSLTYVATWQSGMFQAPDVLEAVQAQKHKRPPKFEELFNKNNQN